MAASRYGHLEAQVTQLLEDGLGEFLANLTDGSGEHQPSVVLGQQLSKAFTSYHDLKSKLEKDSLDCAILALTKSGKSTFLNALGGASILPSNNVPETARIVALEHTHLAEGERPTLKYRYNGEIMEVKGESEIRTHLEILNKNVRSRKHSKDDEQIVTVRTDLAALRSQPTDLAVGLRLLDTPGPNEAGEDALRHSVERLLDSVDAVVYILDYTKLKTQEEAELLTKLSKSNPQLIMRLAQRLFFVVNKIDVMHVSEGLDEDELREYVADVVTKQMNFTTFQLRPEQVLLVSAQDALLSRLILSGKASDEERQRFARKAFGRALRNRSEADYRAEAALMLEESHMPELEDCLLGYLYNHAGSLKIVSLLDGIAKLLTQMKNVAVTSEAAMKISTEKLTFEVENLQQSLTSTSEEFKAVQRKADAVETDVVKNVQERMLYLKDRLFRHIDQVLDPDTTPAPATAGTPYSSWRRIWEKSAAFLLRSRTHENSSDVALKAKLADLHNDIRSQIEEEITDFWHGLETATNVTYQELIAVINQHLLELARKIEGSVGKVLDLCLKPLDICLQRPSAEEFHTSIQDLLTSGIKLGKRQLTKQREVDHVEWQKRYRGICNQSEYYIGVPTKRRETYKEEIPVYSLNAESIKEYFHTMVERSVSVSITNVKDYVHTFMSDQIAKAHMKISNYSALYADAMTAALNAKTLSASEQKANMAALSKNIAAVDALLKSANDIAQEASTLFPQLDLDGYDWITDSEKELEPDYSSLAARLRDLPKLGSKGSSGSGIDPLGAMKQPVNNSPANETVGQSSRAVEATEVKPTVSDTQTNLNTGVTKTGNSDERTSDADAAVQAAMRLAEQFAEQNANALNLEPKHGNSNIFSAQHNSARSVSNDKTVNEEASVHSNSLSMPKLGDSKDSTVPTDVLAEEPPVTLYQNHINLKKGVIPSLIDDEEEESASEHSSVYDEDEDEEEEEDFETQSETSSDGSESGESSESESEYSTSEDEESNSDDSTDSDADSEPKTNPVAPAPFKQPNFVHGIERLPVEQTPTTTEAKRDEETMTALLETIPAMPVPAHLLPALAPGSLPVSDLAIATANTSGDHSAPTQAGSQDGLTSLYQPSHSSDQDDWECVSETEAHSPSATE